MVADFVGLNTFIPSADGLPKTLATTPAEQVQRNEQEGANQQAVAQASSQKPENQGQTPQIQTTVAVTQFQEPDTDGGGDSDTDTTNRGASVDIEA